MKGVIGCVALALLLVAAGVIFVAVSRLEGRLADAHEQAATLQFDQAQQSVDAAVEYSGYTDWVPRLGGELRQEIRVRQAALQYWQRKYDALVAEQPPAAANSESLVDLQLVVANAAFRVGQAQATTRAEQVEALDDAVARYATVLRNGEWRRDAAFNYEYSARLRDEIAKGRKPAAVANKGETDLGFQGGPAAAVKERFEIYIPLEGGERSPTGGDAAKAPPGARKG